MNDQQYFAKDTFSPLFGLEHQYPGLYGAGEGTEPSSKDLGHAVLVDCCEFIQDRDFQKNKCVDRVIADGARHDLNTAARNDWYGPIIIRSANHYDNASWNTITKKRRQQVAGVQRMTDVDSYYRDIQIEDFHFAINHLMAFGDGWATVPEYEFTKSTWKDTELDPVLLEVANERFSNHHLECTAAAKICCLGEQEFLGRDKYIKVQIAFKHPIYQLNPLDISWMLELPLLVRPALLKLEKGEVDWRNKQFLESKQHLNINPYQNYYGRYLNLEMDAESPGWGLPNAQDNFDTILVARQDQKPLLLEHLEALTMFCYDLAGKMKEFRLQENEHPEQVVIGARKRFMREWVCKEGFEKFLEAFKAAKVAAGLTEWENVTSPFN
ncbi:hypothetical protein EYC80_000906 [Monilinia laxa]|uniref:Uncharacterized protein n=1 Tax=Monilinia laxa TaxID=61186 RepID=A0A5N6K8D8_MONLA|nr:hypothetical protein EYC80_000906 [Monilinia laxa]